MKRQTILSGVMLLSVLSLGTLVNSEVAKAETTKVWVPNSVQIIKERISKNTSNYVIQWGDTLSGISEATGLTVNTLARLNNINNIDLIFAGQKISIDGSKGEVSLQNNNGQIVNTVPLTQEDKKGVEEVKESTGNATLGEAPVKPIKPGTPQVNPEPEKPVTPPTEPEKPITPPTEPEEPTSPEVEDGTVVEGEYNGVYYFGLGNSGKTFKTQEEADAWGAENCENSWLTWEVRMKGSNEIRFTVELD